MFASATSQGCTVCAGDAVSLDGLGKSFVAGRGLVTARTK